MKKVFTIVDHFKSLPNPQSDQFKIIMKVSAKTEDWRGNIFRMYRIRSKDNFHDLFAL